jgi:hypothetical protein
MVLLSTLVLESLVVMRHQELHFQTVRFGTVLVSSLLFDSMTSVIFLVEHDTRYASVLHVQDLEGLFD